jgi:hypothetical protein
VGTVCAFAGKKIQKNETIQERALRFIYEDYGNTYENLLKKSKLPSLKELLQLKHSKLSINKVQAIFMI